MPRKQMFSKEEVICAAMNITRREGISGVTARSLGEELGTSSRPIFTTFKNMEDVHRETIYAARELWNEYLDKGLKAKEAFKSVGKQYIRFAQKEPKLFELLFMTSNGTMDTLDDILTVQDKNCDKILQSIMEPYSMSREQAYRFYKDMWICSHGIACLCATRIGCLSDKEIDKLLTEIATGVIINIKSGENY